MLKYYYLFKNKILYLKIQNMTQLEILVCVGSRVSETYELNKYKLMEDSSLFFFLIYMLTLTMKSSKLLWTSMTIIKRNFIC